jgi:hypothetical protein
MNLVTQENLFIIGFILIIVIGIQYIIYLQLKKLLLKEIGKLNRLTNGVNRDIKQANKTILQPSQPSQPSQPLQPKQPTQPNKETDDETDDESDIDSNIDSYVNPLPSINNDE